MYCKIEGLELGKLSINDIEKHLGTDFEAMLARWTTKWGRRGPKIPKKVLRTEKVVVGN